MPSRAELINRANVMGLDPSGYPNDSKLEQKVIWLETNASTMAGTLATGTLTQGGAAANGDQVEIDGVVYTYVTALSEAKATGTYTNASVAVAGETVTIDGITYTYAAAISATAEQPYAVLVGANPTASLANLIKAIDDSGTEGTHYGIGTAAHPRVSGVSSDATTAVVTYDTFGVIGNSALTSENAAGSWGASALAGGVDAVPYEIALTGVAATELDSLKQAINNGDTEGAGEGEGTAYSTGTQPHPTVTATTNGAATQVVQARYMAVGEDISTTDPVDTGTVLSFAATTLASGVADQNAVSADAKAQTSGGANV